MREELYQYVVTQSGTLSTTEIVICFIVAVIMGGIIFVSYRFSHAASVYSAKFNVSLVMLTLVTTLVMCVIGNNVALSLGMVGALSIVRFRTAVKDSRDTAYIFWCIAVGICCGIGDYIVAGVGCGFIFVTMIFLGNVRNNERYLLIVRGKAGVQGAEQVVYQYFDKKAYMRVYNEDRNGVELMFEVSAAALKKCKKKNQGRDIKNMLFEIADVEAVNLVCQNDEITR